MTKAQPKLSVAIPAAIVSDIPHLREKTLRIGLIGRAAAIFRVREIVVFPDQPGAGQKRDRALIATLLSYMETPQYLRKRLFKLKPELRYVGVLPPLRTPHHPLERRVKKLKRGEFREGVVVAVSESGSLVDVGVERPVLVPGRKLSVNRRVTVKITDTGKVIKAALSRRDETGAYWGYTVKTSKESFGRLVKSGGYDLVVATSKLGVPIMQVTGELTKKWRNARKVLVAFGAPTKGLYEISEKENLRLEDVADFVVNTVPRQGTETVRTEEAIYASLALMNVLTDW